VSDDMYLTYACRNCVQLLSTEQLCGVAMSAIGNQCMVLLLQAIPYYQQGYVTTYV
jgi:hypothetical protein